ncbi:GntR family transcriptional regulator [Paenibacillus filicis]|uniref:GntR family transcriptional regulator n=1 Tax=Paenibacillus gyeongsangnamensis TaxID=3388067 RepID=A0ABT4Q506_9BACL|nr:GntR family transcriptional regulator [Paenibacillus filicis]MCZ8511938.1 GntR family transcriptional regulator [Paenibacillus filicis]
MKLSRSSRPLYLQIKNIIKDRILHGVYPLGMNIPSEPELETEFNVSKITVRNAIKELAQEGYLEKSSGKGTKVIRNTSASKLSKWKRFTEVLVEEGHQIQKQLLQAKVVSNEEGTEPYRLFGERCLLIERIYRLNGKPYIHYIHYLTTLLEDAELSDLNQESLYGLIEDHDISLEKYRDEFAVAVAPAHVEEILGVPNGTALLQRSRYSYDDRGVVIEYSKGYYNTQMGNYVIHYDA